ncbi:MAG TPA: transketolase family protein [Patescibacteria group bacterium]|nr:transketolase family protein [Patescibacteria group bacterium]
MQNTNNVVPVILKSTRDGFGRALVELGAMNANVVALTADLSESTRVEEFAARFPERFFDVGVAEQNLMGVSAGLALSGKIPFAASYGVFSPGRNWDQLRVSVCYSNANVKIVSSHAGLMVGPDGATHQALEDIAITRVLPNMTVVVPCDFLESTKATHALADFSGPAYLRLCREPCIALTDESTPFSIGKANVMQLGSDVTIIGCGPILQEAIKAADLLRRDSISVELINLHTIKPIDVETLTASVKKTGCVVTVEDHQIIGGMGSAVAESLVKNFPVPIEFIGMQDSFGESGKPQELLEKYGMTAHWITRAVRQVIARKRMVSN